MLFSTVTFDFQDSILLWQLTINGSVRTYDRYDTFDSTPQIQDPCIFVNVHEILVQYERTYDRTCAVDNKSKYGTHNATTFFYCSVEQLGEVTFIARTRT